MIFSKISKPFTAILAASKTTNGAPTLNVDEAIDSSTESKSLESSDVFGIQKADYDFWDAEVSAGLLTFNVGGTMANIGGSLACAPGNVAICVPFEVVSATLALSGAMMVVGGILSKAHESSLERGDGGLDERFARKLGKINFGKIVGISEAEVGKSSTFDSIFGNEGIKGRYNQYEIIEQDIRQKIAGYQSPYHGSKIKRLWLMDNWVFRHQNIKKNKNVNKSSTEDADLNDETLNVAATNITLDDVSKGVKLVPGLAKEGAKKVQDGINKELDQVQQDYQREGAKQTVKYVIDRMIDRFPQPAFAVFYESDIGIHVSMALRGDITPDELINLILSTDQSKPLGVDEDGKFDVRFLTYSFNLKEDGGFYSNLKNYLTQTNDTATDDVSTAGIFTDYLSKFNPVVEVPADGKNHTVTNLEKYCGSIDANGKKGPIGEYYLNSYGPVEDRCADLLKE